MARVVYSAASRSDMQAIWLWYARESGTDLADRILDTIEARIARLGTYPALGPPRPDIAATARALAVNRWIVLYEIQPGHVRVIRVQDSVQDLSKIEWLR